MKFEEPGEAALVADSLVNSNPEKMIKYTSNAGTRKRNAVILDEGPDCLDGLSDLMQLEGGR